MKYDGVVIRFDSLYLFVLDPDTNKIMDGINISEHDCYKELKEDYLMVVDVTFKDGTQEIDKIDLDEFIHGDSYGQHDTFIYIHDIMLYSIGSNEGVNITLDDLVREGEIDKVAISCIEDSKKQLKTDE